MKKKLFLIGCSLLAVSLAGCAPLKAVMRPVASVEKTKSAPLASYSGLKARIAVADFDVKTTKTGGEIGSDLRQMLVNALINSNRFSVIEHRAQGADLIITAAVTEFEPQASGGRAGIGGGGGVSSGRFGGLLGISLNKAHMALEIRIVDASTQEAIAASLVQGQATDTSGISMTDFLGREAFDTGLSIYANTPMEKAIRLCIIETVRYVSEAVPKNYYKY